MANEMGSLAIFAILIEAIITYVKEFFVNGSFSWELLASISLGIIIAIAYNLDIPAYFNLNSQIPYLGCVLTGVLLSRGSNYAYDLLGKLTNI